MQVISANPEPKLIELVNALRGDPGENYALNFRLSQLLEANRSDFQLKIAINILNDVFRGAEGSIFLCKNSDVVVVYHGEDRILLEKAIFQLRYLFIDDPLAANEDGTENEEFCSMWDLGFQWRPFHSMCQERLESLNRVFKARDKEIIAENRKERPASQSLDPEGLVEVIKKLRNVELSLAMRSQPICANSSGRDMRPIFTENYISIAHLGKLLGVDYNLLSDRHLFKYITTHLDKFVLETIDRRPNLYLSKPISLNLNVDTLLSSNFAEFSRTIGKAAKSVILEINISDVFADMNMFNVARETAQAQGYRICLDGMTSVSFTQVDRESLGFDLAKLYWNADMEGDLNTPENRKLAVAVQKCGPNRMILCRCDSYHAIDYGKALGISLFQGRYPDRILNPDAKVIN